MPASLTNQIRLGFSLGWRIWTPNEVGFYAKSLAHSYFIFNVLGSKFFMKKIWVVNYSIFVGIRKYYVFIEYLKFGIKTKEERSFWKKVMFVSLLLRHNRFVRREAQTHDSTVGKSRRIYRYFRRTLAKPYQTIVHRNRSKFNNYVERVRIGQIRKTDIPVRILNNFLQRPVNLLDRYTTSRYKLLTARNQARTVNLGLKDMDFAADDTKETTAMVLANSLLIGKRGVRTKIVRAANESTAETNNSTENTEETQEIKHELSDMGSRFRFRKANCVTPMEVFGELSKIGKKKIVNRISYSNVDNTTRSGRRYWLFAHGKKLTNDWEVSWDMHKVDTMEDNKKIILSEVTDGIRAATRVTPLCYYSFAGGPRMRKYRKLKRSFQSKNIIKYTSLIWFWEKVSKLLSYYVDWTVRYLK